MKKVAIIQARMNSSRLPGKVLFKLGDREVLKLVYDRVRKSNIDEVVIATTNNPLDDEIENFCERNSIKCFRGSENDVLGRVHECAVKYDADVIVEITADCPFVDYRHINEMLKFFCVNLSPFKYVSNCFPRSFPDGFDVQIFNMTCLETVVRMPGKNIEHVGWNIQNLLSDIVLEKKHYPASGKYRRPEIGLTLDTKEDYELLGIISDVFIFGNHTNKLDEISAEEIIDFLLDNPKLLEINKSVQREIPGE